MGLQTGPSHLNPAPALEPQAWLESFQQRWLSLPPEVAHSILEHFPMVRNFSLTLQLPGA